MAGSAANRAGSGACAVVAGSAVQLIAQSEWLGAGERPGALSPQCPIAAIAIGARCEGAAFAALMPNGINSMAARASSIEAARIMPV